MNTSAMNTFLNSKHLSDEVSGHKICFKKLLIKLHTYQLCAYSIILINIFIISVIHKLIFQRKEFEIC